MNLSQILLTALLHLSFIGVVPAQTNTYNSKSNKTSKNKTRIPLNVMGESQNDIKLILSQYKPEEGAFIQLIRRMPNSTYKVDVKTIANHCIGSRIKILKDKKTKKKALTQLSRVYDCD